MTAEIPVADSNACDCDDDNNCGCSYPNNIQEIAETPNLKDPHPWQNSQAKS